jgi:hypothetical protein
MTRKGLELVRHMVKQIDARTDDVARLRLSCSLDIAEDIAADLAELDAGDKVGGLLKKRAKRGEYPLQPGDHVYGCTVTQVFRLPDGAAGYAWIATTP